MRRVALSSAGTAASAADDLGVAARMEEDEDVLTCIVASEVVDDEVGQDNNNNNNNNNSPGDYDDEEDMTQDPDEGPQLTGTDASFAATKPGAPTDRQDGPARAFSVNAAGVTISDSFYANVGIVCACAAGSSHTPFLEAIGRHCEVIDWLRFIMHERNLGSLDQQQLESLRQMQTDLRRHVEMAGCGTGLNFLWTTDLSRSHL